MALEIKMQNEAGDVETIAENDLTNRLRLYDLGYRVVTSPKPKKAKAPSPPADKPPEDGEGK